MAPLSALLAVFLFPQAQAALAPECEGTQAPDDYNEQVQQDFLANFPALFSTLSPIHAPIPHEPGTGSIGLDLSYVPQLGCDQRTVLSYTKTEDTNKTPILPRPRVIFSFRPIALGNAEIISYGGFALLPPVPIDQTYNTMVSTEFGMGMRLSSMQLGLRAHMTLQRTVGNIAGAFNPEEDPEYADVYFASSSGVDVSVGYEMERMTPYLSVGMTEVQSYFWIGDNDAEGGAVMNNLHPYFGPAISLGTDVDLTEKIGLAGELYAATGGYSKLSGVTDNVDNASRYGNIYTGRVRLSYELGRAE